MLGIAPGHLYNLRSHFDLFSSPLLPASAASLTHQKRNLVTRPALVDGTAENLTRHRHQCGVVVKRPTRVSANFAECLTNVGQRFGTDFESKDVALEVRFAWITRQIARRTTRNQLLDLTNGASAYGYEPSMLGFGSGDARQFARSGPTRRAVAKRLLELRQGLERFRHAKPFFGPAWLVAEKSFDVLGKRAVPEVKMNAGSKTEKQRAPLFPVESRSRVRKAHEVFVRALPIGPRRRPPVRVVMVMGMAAHLCRIARPF
jgi:hypothetical protein